MQKANNKYNANAFYYHPLKQEKIPVSAGYNPRADGHKDWWFFASKLEWDVFEVLESFFDTKDIAKDEPMMICQRDKIQVTYKPDFTVHHGNKVYYIEAKGYFTEVSRLKLKYLAVGKPELDYRIALVFGFDPYRFTNRGGRKYQIMKTDLPYWYFSVDTFNDYLVKHSVTRKFFQKEL